MALDEIVITRFTLFSLLFSLCYGSMGCFKIYVREVKKLRRSLPVIF